MALSRAAKADPGQGAPSAPLLLIVTKTGTVDAQTAIFRLCALTKIYEYILIIFCH
jgi:hypothetical protein